MQNKLSEIRYFLLMCFIFYSIQGHAQLKEVKQTNHQLNITEEYSVRKENRKIKEGPYLKYISTPTRGKILIAKGQYVENEKAGVWEFYDSKGHIAMQYNFDNDSISIYNQMRVNGLKKERPLIYLGSIFELRHISAMALDLPKGVPFTGKKGKVIVSIKVNELGQVTGFEIKDSFSKRIDNAVLEAVKQVPQTWLPAISNGKKVAFHFELPVSFFL